MPEDSWNLIEGIGISRVLKVNEVSRSNCLGSAPCGSREYSNGENTRQPDTSLHFPSPFLRCHPRGRNWIWPAYLVFRFHNWVSAFQECAEYTLRALSFPTEPGKLAAPTTRPSVGKRWEQHAAFFCICDLLRAVYLCRRALPLKWQSKVLTLPSRSERLVDGGVSTFPACPPRDAARSRFYWCADQRSVVVQHTRTWWCGHRCAVHPNHVCLNFLRFLHLNLQPTVCLT